MADMIRSQRNGPLGSSSRPSSSWRWRRSAARAGFLTLRSTSCAPNPVAWKHQRSDGCESWKRRTPSSRVAGRSAPGRARAQERSGGKTLAPHVKRETITRLIAKHQMSERHACRLVVGGLSRDSYRNAPVASAQAEALETKIVEVTHSRPGASGIGACNTCFAWTSPGSITSGRTRCTKMSTGLCASAKEGARAIGRAHALEDRHKSQPGVEHGVHQ